VKGDKVKGIPYSEVKAEALQNKDVLAAYEEARRLDGTRASNSPNFHLVRKLPAGPPVQWSSVVRV
jgi:hypothetical protein